MSDTPPVKRLIGLPIYLALIHFTLFALGIAGGTLWSLSVWVSENRYAAADTGIKINSLHEDVDRRLNEAAQREADTRKALEDAIASEKEHIAVLEAQMNFVADRVPPVNLPAGPRR
ncbi:MAG TPA: hypothetical protein VGM32_23000 [Rhodopila sp.]|jgi:hypothetical protein